MLIAIVRYRQLLQRLLPHKQRGAALHQLSGHMAQAQMWCL
jgi:hypothetical protein